MFLSNLFKSGWLHALFIAIIAYPLGAITAKIVASGMDCNILVYTVIFTISSAVALLVRSGPGSLGIQTLKRPETWLYAFAQIFVLIFGILIMKYVSATEGAGLYRVTGLFILILSVTFLSQKTNKYEILSSLIICLGLFFILNNTDISFELKCLLFLFVCGRALAQSSQKIITELHKTNRKATNSKDESRVAGFIMMTAGVVMLTVLLIVAYIKQDNDIELFKSFPNFSDFAHLNGYIMAVIMGLFIVSISKHCEFYAGKTIGARYLVALLSLQIIFVYIIENILSKFSLMSATNFLMDDFIGIGLILLGNLIIALSGFIKDLSFIKKGEKQDTLENLDDNFIDDEDDFNLVKLNLSNLLNLYDNNLIKLSKDLDINKVLLDNIINYEFGDFKLLNKVAKKINNFASKNVSITDKLTKAYNRYYLEHKINQLISNNTEFKIYYLDLNKFKPINDQYGHETGDYVLQQVVLRLKELGSFNDNIFRVGGDEFVLIQTELLEKNFSTKITKAIEQPISFKDLIVEVSSAIGISSSSKFKNIDQMINYADRMMLKDKAR